MTVECFFFRRRRLLKALLSLSLASATLLTLHRLRVPESGAKARPAAAAAAAARRPANATLAPAAAWDVRVANCTADESLRAKEWFRRLEPRFQQYALRRHCRYFPMLIDHPEKCRAEDVHLLVVVKSVIEQHDRREAVRRTWGREQALEGGRRVKTLFLLGAPSAGKDHKNLQKLLEYEDRLYGDILQWDFMDTFFNLTLKEVNFLRWFALHCARARFVFKGDDDVFVHTGNLLELIDFKAQEAGGARSLFVGDTISKAIPIRNRESKYYIPRELFDQPYPPYVGGGGFLMSSELARRLLLASEALELYPIDDVFLGMCLQRLRVAPELHPGFRTFGISKRKVSPMNNDPCFFRSLIVVHRLGAQELLRMWRLVHNRDLACAKRALL
ncbi:UDP-GlcNAc:betaGal beta-1,3-N-acetylglucosaminyltransferase 7, like [Scleropages formosus]|uniref:UDP-GlcNAc:betaGal beta-1,3-N-acetylglucosaminyltransferase 7, like n=1 Tax=Scleropages formosus TaxID=113540 RepID=UPI0010FAC8B9|nr:UDP-GlcNAc:betaGal beta-1,3-N-acetylglucosaminyltransferase 7-like [Scleropages formosus]